VSDPDRLAEIKAREFGPTRADADWLVGEVERLRERLIECQGSEFHGMHTEMVGLHRGLEVQGAEVDRLRGLLARLEWAGQPTPGERIGTHPRCPVCRETKPPHDRGCWLAAELHREGP
jgi:hypothetical protein